MLLLRPLQANLQVEQSHWTPASTNLVLLRANMFHNVLRRLLVDASVIYLAVPLRAAVSSCVDSIGL